MRPCWRRYVTGGVGLRFGFQNSTTSPSVCLSVSVYLCQSFSVSLHLPLSVCSVSVSLVLVGKI